MEVSARLWVGMVVGNRSYHNVKRCLFGVLCRGKVLDRFFLTTDGFEMYGWAVKRHLIGVCIYGQVIKKRKKNRITSVQRRLVRGSQEALENVLLNSEDSSTLNTSFVERHNLTIRQGSSYLRRRTACHARQTSALKDHLELLQLHYNFIRPHSALKFGREVRTPAMQAGLASRRLSFRDVFSRVLAIILCLVSAMRVAAWDLRRGNVQVWVWWRWDVRLNNT